MFKNVKRDHFLHLKKRYTYQCINDFWPEELPFLGVPHISDYYAFLLVESGEAKQELDFRPFPLIANSSSIVAPGQLNCVKISPGSKVHLFCATSSFFNTHILTPVALLQLQLFFHLVPIQPIRFSQNQNKQVLDFLARLEDEQKKTPSPFCDLKIGALAKLAFLEFAIAHHPVASLRVFPPNGRRVDIVRQFFSNLNQHYRTHHQVQQMAALQDLTSNYLNEVVKAETGFSAKDLIQSRLILEAKRIGFIEPWSMKEVAQELGFGDVAHFSRFFKKMAGETFSAFRASQAAR